MKMLSIAFLIALMPLSPIYALKRPGIIHRKHTAQRPQYGIASWYGAKQQGRLMACGRPFDDHKLIAAHRTLPLGTRVKVTNLRNGRSVIVRIEDRGPMIAGRIIDLSLAAARRLGFVNRGLAPVKITRAYPIAKRGEVRAGT